MHPSLFGIFLWGGIGIFFQRGWSGVGGLWLHREEVVETEVLKKREITRVRPNDAEKPLLGFAEAESQGGKCPHESRVHEFAFFEIENELHMPLGDHAAGKFLEALAIFKSAPTIDLHPDYPCGASDTNARQFAHEILKKPKITRPLLSQPLAPHRRLAETHHAAIHDQQSSPSGDEAVFQKIITRDLKCGAMGAARGGIVALLGHHIIAESGLAVFQAKRDIRITGGSPKESEIRSVTLGDFEAVNGSPCPALALKINHATRSSTRRALFDQIGIEDRGEDFPKLEGIVEFEREDIGLVQARGRPFWSGTTRQRDGKHRTQQEKRANHGGR